MARPRGLGRGLNSLIPEKTALETQPIEATPRDGVFELPVESLSANPRQPRRHFEPNALDALAASIREHGIVQPLIVTERGDGRYELVAGERRFRAAKIVGLATVPVLVRTASEQEKLEIAILENVQRHDLSPIEEAIAYKRLMDEFGMIQEDVARRIGKARASVANTLRLLLLSEEIRQALEVRTITEGHAKVLLSVEDEAARLAFFQKVVQEDLSVRALERLVQEGFAVTDGDAIKIQTRSASALPVELAAAEDAFRHALGAPVRIRPGKKGGKVEITYFAPEELSHFLDRMGGTTDVS